MNSRKKDDQALEPSSHAFSEASKRRQKKRKAAELACLKVGHFAASKTARAELQSRAYILLQLQIRCRISSERKLASFCGTCARSLSLLVARSARTTFSRQAITQLSLSLVLPSIFSRDTLSACEFLRQIFSSADPTEWESKDRSLPFAISQVDICHERLDFEFHS